MPEKYTIEVSDECVEIRGKLTIEKAFDLLCFYEKEGYTCLEDLGDRTTIYLTKKDLDKDITNRINKDTLENLKNAQDELVTLRECKKQRGERITLLESFIKNNSKELEQKNCKIKELESHIFKYTRFEKLCNNQDVKDIIKPIEEIK